MGFFNIKQKKEKERREDSYSVPKEKPQTDMDDESLNSYEEEEEWLLIKSLRKKKEKDDRLSERIEMAKGLV